MCFHSFLLQPLTMHLQADFMQTEDNLVRMFRGINRGQDKHLHDRL